MSHQNLPTLAKIRLLKKTEVATLIFDPTGICLSVGLR